MKILLCSYFKFPSGCAGAVRHEKFAQMLQSIGHEVLVVALGPYNAFKMDTFKEIPYTSLRNVSQSLLSKMKMRFSYWKRCKKIANKFSPDCILMDDMRLGVTPKMKRYARKKGILLIHDSVEWYSKEQFKYRKFSSAYMAKDILNRFLIDKSVRVISISNYLHEYYTSKGIRSVNIPIVASDEDFVKDKNLHEMLGSVISHIKAKYPIFEIVALIDKENEKSISLFKKLGFVQECYAESINSLVFVK